MRTTFISTTTLWNSPRTALGRLQDDLAKANKEVTTGRHADVGLKLGSQIEHAISLRQQRSELDTMIDSNALTKGRLKMSSTVLTNVHDSAVKFLNVLVAAPSGVGTPALIKGQAELYLNGLVSDLNTSVSGQYIFGGTNTREKPLKEYAGTGSPTDPKQVIADAFATKFGFAQNSPLVSGITPDQMLEFLQDDLAPHFEGSSWDTFSNAASQNIQSRISSSEVIETSASADSKAIRQIVQAYTMVLDLGLEGLSTETRGVVLSKAIESLSQGIAGAVEIQAGLGIAQEKIENADERMDLQKIVFEEGIGHLEAVDPAEAKVRLDQITTQIQMSYSLTAQLRQMSLIHFL